MQSIDKPQHEALVQIDGIAALVPDSEDGIVGKRDSPEDKREETQDHHAVGEVNPVGRELVVLKRDEVAAEDEFIGQDECQGRNTNYGRDALAVTLVEQVTRHREHVVAQQFAQERKISKALNQKEKDDAHGQIDIAVEVLHHLGLQRERAIQERSAVRRKRRL